MKFKIYGKPNCQYCDVAKSLIKLHGYEYEYIDVTENGEGLELLRMLRRKTVPLIILKHRIIESAFTVIGGSDDLQAFLKEQE